MESMANKVVRESRKRIEGSLVHNSLKFCIVVNCTLLPPLRLMQGSHPHTISYNLILNAKSHKISYNLIQNERFSTVSHTISYFLFYFFIYFWINPVLHITFVTKCTLYTTKPAGTLIVIFD